jgi:hypothetical protein
MEDIQKKTDEEPPAEAPVNATPEPEQQPAPGIDSGTQPEAELIVQENPEELPVPVSEEPDASQELVTVSPPEPAPEEEPRPEENAETRTEAPAEPQETAVSAPELPATAQEPEIETGEVPPPPVIIEQAPAPEEQPAAAEPAHKLSQEPKKINLDDSKKNLKEVLVFVKKGITLKWTDHKNDRGLYEALEKRENAEPVIKEFKNIEEFYAYAESLGFTR